MNDDSGRGWFVGSAPIAKANWNVGGQKRTLPTGPQVGCLIKVGSKLPVALLIGAYYNALRPQYGATWRFRTQIAFIF